MKTPRYLLPLTLGALLVGSQATAALSNHAAAADVTVVFQDSDKFTDARDSMGGQTNQAYLDILGKHLKEKASARLPAGQKLAVTFTDIDLAGDFLPGPRPGFDRVRIIKSIYIPRMKLSFQVLDATGKVVKEGQRSLSNLNFQEEANPIRLSEELYYDKELLSRWLSSEFR